MVSPEDVTGAVFWEAKADSGADVSSHAADAILKRARLKDFFLHGFKHGCSDKSFDFQFLRLKHGKLKGERKGLIMFLYCRGV